MPAALVPFTIVFLNINGLNSKCSEVVTVAQRERWHVTALCETKLKETHSLACPSGWQWITSDPIPANERASGGLAFLICPELGGVVSSISCPPGSSSEQLWIRLNLTTPVSLGVTYVRPGLSSDLTRIAYNDLCATIDHFSASSVAIGGGDLNAHTGICADPAVDTAGRNLLQAAVSHDLRLVNTFFCSGMQPTRCVVDADGIVHSSVLDYALVSSRYCPFVSTVEILADPTRAPHSDHLPLLLTLTVPLPSTCRAPAPLPTKARSKRAVWRPERLCADNVDAYRASLALALAEAEPRGLCGPNHDISLALIELAITRAAADNGLADFVSTGPPKQHRPISSVVLTLIAERNMWRARLRQAISVPASSRELQELSLALSSAQRAVKRQLRKEARLELRARASTLNSASSSSRLHS